VCLLSLVPTGCKHPLGEQEYQWPSSLNNQGNVVVTTQKGDSNQEEVHFVPSNQPQRADQEQPDN